MTSRASADLMNASSSARAGAAPAPRAMPMTHHLDRNMALPSIDVLHLLEPLAPPTRQRAARQAAPGVGGRRLLQVERGAQHLLAEDRRLPEDVAVGGDHPALAVRAGGVAVGGGVGVDDVDGVLDRPGLDLGAVGAELVLLGQRR